MATRRVPFQDLKTAEFFAAKMANPWEPEVLELQQILTKNVGAHGFVESDTPTVNSEFEWQSDDLFRTFRNDKLTDILYARTRYYQKPFDMRPSIREVLRPILQSEKEFYLKHGRFSRRRYKVEPMNVVRLSLGLVPLPGTKKRRLGSLFGKS